MNDKTLKPPPTASEWVYLLKKHEAPKQIPDKPNIAAYEPRQKSNVLTGTHFTALPLACTIKKDDFSAKMKTLFEKILENDGPYYIHCLEGKDRTGYVCMVIEALCGATYDELVEDYFITYKNYYGIEKGTDKYEAIKALHIDEMIKYVFSFEDESPLLGSNFYTKAHMYLKSIGLTDEQINLIQDKLTI